MTTGYDAMRAALTKLDLWFDTDPEILQAMSHDERADHQRQHKMIREALFIARHERMHNLFGKG